jgi:hypothetical protein
MISTRTRAILSLLGVFLLGVIAGGGVLALYLKGEVSDAQSMNDPKSFSGFIEERLRLSEAQRDSLRDELGLIYEDLAALRNASAETYNELIDTFARRVAPQLDPEQRKLLDRLEERLRRRLSRGAVRGTTRPSIVDSVDYETSTARTESTIPATPADTPSRGKSPDRPPITNRKPETPAATLPNQTAAAAVDSAARDMQNLETDAEGMPGGALVPNIDTLRTRLGLGPEQFRSIRRIIRETRQKTRGELGGLRGFPKLQKEALRRNLREMDLRIEALLNEQQRVEYRAHRERIYQRIRDNKLKLKEKRPRN